MIESAKLIGDEQSKLLTQEKLLSEEVQIKQSIFQKQAPTKQALVTDTDMQERYRTYNPLWICLFFDGI